MEEKAGVGIEITHDEIVEAVKQVVEKNREALVSERYCFPIIKLLYVLDSECI